MSASTSLSRITAPWSSCSRNQEATASPERKQDIVNQVIRELSVHAAIEEEILYPTVRESLPDGDELAQEGLREHQQVKEVLAELDGMSSDDPDQRMGQLIEDIPTQRRRGRGRGVPQVGERPRRRDPRRRGPRAGERREVGSHPTVSRGSCGAPWDEDRRPRGLPPGQDPGQASGDEAEGFLSRRVHCRQGHHAPSRPGGAGEVLRRFTPSAWRRRKEASSLRSGPWLSVPGTSRIAGRD
jgi:hypothetical protein